MTSPPDLSDTFFLSLVNVCARLDCDALDLAQVMYSESIGIRPSAHNPHGHASGIIQFMPFILPGVGWSKGHEAFRALSAEDQLPYVERYYRPHAHRTGVGGQRIPQLVHAAHIYTVNFLPARLGAVVAAGEGWRGVDICNRSTILPWAYKDNPALDFDKDGDISAGDLADHLERVCRGTRWDAIERRIRVARGEAIPEPPDSSPTLPELPRMVPPDNVRAYQARLTALGYSPGPADGVHGPVTDAAVRAFQSRYKLKSDGIVGPKTSGALAAAQPR